SRGLFAPVCGKEKVEAAQIAARSVHGLATALRERTPADGGAIQQSSGECPIRSARESGGTDRLPRMPVHHDRSRVAEARISGLAITLSVAALILALLYVVGGYANHVVVVIVDSVPTASVR